MRVAGPQGQDTVQSLFALRLGAALAAVFLFSALFNVLMLTAPLYVVQLYSRILTSRSLDTLVMLTVLAGGALVFATFFDLIRRSVLQKIAYRLFLDLGERAIPAALGSAMPPAEKARPLQDIEVVRRFIAGPNITTMMDVPFSALFLALLFFIHPVIGSLAIAMAAVMLLLALWNAFASASLQRQVSEGMRQSADEFALFAANAPAVSSMGMTGSVLSRWHAAQARIAERLQRSESRTSFASGLSQWLRAAMQIVVLAAATYYALKGDLNPGMLIASSILATRAVAPLQGLITGQQEFRRARDAYRRLSRLLLGARTQGQLRHVPATGRLEVQDLVVLSPVNRMPVLKKISFEVAEGEVVAIVGPSGAGKSMLGQCLTGALEPASGVIRVDGIDLKTCDRDVMSRHFGYLGQGRDELPGTVGENIARFGEIDHEMLSRVVRLFDLEADIGRLPERLNAPMRRAAAEMPAGLYRRLLLARAFYAMPKLIVLDEPSADLDMDGDRLLSQAIQQARDNGSTIVMITPRGPLRDQADRVLVLRDGNLEAPRDKQRKPQFNAGAGHSVVRLMAE